MSSREPIAIVGIGCRLPGEVNDPEGFWRLLCERRDPIREVPAERWDATALHGAKGEDPGQLRSRFGGFVSGIDRFDAEFFGISPREAQRMDPQHRLLLEVAWEALEDAGAVVSALAGTRTGVFVGISSHDYGDITTASIERREIDAYTNIGTATSIAANRISHQFDLRGPSLSVDTACSSSLVALHLACQSLWRGESDTALVGGVNALLRPEVGVGFSRAGMLSPDGRCFSFDARANGFVRSEGAGVIFLKPLASARRDGDRVYALVRQTIVNQDGRTPGLSQPSLAAQVAMLEEAYREAGLPPEHVAYVEAHGTGTAVGDPIEARALGRILGAKRPPLAPCLLGSVKSNIGHLEAASGIAGVIKTALCLSRRRIAPNLHFETPNPEIAFAETGLRVPTEVEPWPGRLLAGVNSFGFGGSNAHVVLEGLAEIGTEERSASPHPGPPKVDSPRLLLLSAKSDGALRALAESYRADLTRDEQARSDTELGQLCSAAALRRAHHERRLALTFESPTELMQLLASARDGVHAARVAEGQTASTTPERVVFVFSGVGTQWWGMGRELLEKSNEFRESIEVCDRLFARFARRSLLKELASAEGAQRFGRTEVAQPLIFAVQVALVRWLEERGVTPDALVGHSLGEVAAAHVAGTLDLEDALRVVFERSRLQARCEGRGRMLALGLGEVEARALTAQGGAPLSIAALNGPESVTLSGDETALRAIAEVCATRGIFERFLDGNVAYHSPQMDPILPELVESLAALRPRKNLRSLWSTVTGNPLRGSELDANYWGRNARDPVLFRSAVAGLLAEGFTLFLEVGAHPVLGRYILNTARALGRSAVTLHTLAREESALVSLTRALGGLYAAHARFDAARVFAPQPMLRLPSYPWQRQRYWHESETSRRLRTGSSAPVSLASSENAAHDLLGARVPSARPLWQNQIDTRRQAFLADHRVVSDAVFPAAGYIDCWLSASAEGHESTEIVLERVRFSKPLLLSEEPCLVETSIDPSSDEISTCSRRGAGEFVRHADARVVRRRKESAHSGCVPSAFIANAAPALDSAACYRRFAEQGLAYGPAFQTISRLWCRPGEALAELRELEPKSSLGELSLAPPLLDGCFQALLGAQLGSERERALFLPTNIERLRYSPQRAATEGPLYAHARMRTESAQRVSADIRLVDATGRVLLEVDGFVAQNITAEPDSDESADLLYRHTWLPAPEPRSVTPLERRAGLGSIERACSRALPVARNIWARLERDRFYEQVEPALDRLTRAYVVTALGELGWTLSPGSLRTLDDLTRDASVLPQHRRQLYMLLGFLVEDGTLVEHDGTFTVLKESAEPRPAECFRELVSAYPTAVAELGLLQRCGAALSAILRGDCDPLALLFQSDSPLLEQFYEASPSLRAINLTASAWIEGLVAELPREKTLRVLEIGAGTGGTTAHLLRCLDPRRTQYVFSDVGANFLGLAQQKFQEFTNVEYRVLDIEQDPLAQGFQAHSFDLVVASNALHAVRELRSALTHVRRLLARDGVLALIECTRVTRWNHFVFGLLKGWWHFTDLELRPHAPWLDFAAWQAVLGEQGFSSVHDMGDSARHAPASRVIMARLAPAGASESVMRAPPEVASSRWVLFADTGGVAQRLAALLSERGANVSLVLAGAEFECNGRDARVRPEVAADYVRCLHELRFEPGAKVLHLASLDSVSNSCGSVLRDLERTCLGGLYLAQALGERAVRADLCWVTAGAQRIAHEVPALTASPLWGLARVVANEQPELVVRSVDLSSVPTDEELILLASELVAGSEEREVALRGGDRYVHRMLPIRAADLAIGTGEQHAFRLLAERGGAIDRLRAVPLEALAPGPLQVEVELRSVGLNFKDLANLTGLLPEDLARDPRSGELIVGQECAGVVVSVGEGVTELVPGQRVMGYAPCSLGTRTLADARFMVPVPEHLTWEEAATPMLVFATALYALRDLARVQPGETILLHSAAGALGLATLQLARLFGARVIATAGTASKREFLKALGVEFVFDSRSLAFFEEVQRVTAGRGVDVVMNSLAGEAMERSLALLAPFGRFLELGKRDLAADRRIGLSPFLRSLGYFGVALDRYTAELPERASRLFHDVGQLLATRQISPLPLRTYPVSATRTALRQMAQGRHIGKFVVSLQEGLEQTPVVRASSPPPRLSLPAAASYLITGGFGGLGLAIAERLVARGARHLALMGRRGADTPGARAKLQSLLERGVRVEVVAGDVSVESDVLACLTQIRTTLPPLRGIVHAAMVLDDGVLSHLDRERFERVLRPKAHGAWWLHEHTRLDPLDFFVLFSSFTSALGNPGQANYVAANAFLDALAGYRRQAGLQGLTLGWGQIGDVGYVSDKREVADALLEKGVRPIRARVALDLFEELVLHANTLEHVLVWSGDWDRVADQLPAVGATPRFTELRRGHSADQTAPKQGLDRAALLRAEPGRRREMIQQFFRTQVAKVMATVPEKVPPSSKLTDLGVDSLMAVELRNLSLSNLGVEIPTTKLLGGNSIAELADFIFQHFAPAFQSECPTAEVHETPLEPLPPGAPRISELTDDELDDQLTRVLLELEEKPR